MGSKVPAKKETWPTRHTNYTKNGTEYPTANKESPMKKERAYDLQDRLVDYAVRIIKLSEALPETKAGKHVSTQIL